MGSLVEIDIEFQVRCLCVKAPGDLSKISCRRTCGIPNLLMFTSAQNEAIHRTMVMESKMHVFSLTALKQATLLIA